MAPSCLKFVIFGNYFKKRGNKSIKQSIKLKGPDSDLNNPEIYMQISSINLWPQKRTLTCGDQSKPGARGSATGA